MDQADTVGLAQAGDAIAALSATRRPLALNIQPALSISPRTRVSHWHDRVIASGAKSFTVYNHMLLPTMFESLEADYWHLREHVQVWDVAAERQIRLKGPHARRLVQLMTPRDVRKLTPGRCLYAPLIDTDGAMVNDPILLGIADDEVWVSIADSDVLLWARGLAAGFGLDVQIDEPDISPLAVQGPKSDALMVRLFGTGIVDLKVFRWAYFPFGDTQLLIARSGWSHQGGFEIYVEGRAIAENLWDALMAEGQDLSVRAGCPNLIERIESGLMSYGNDMTRADTALMCGLERFCDPKADVDCLGSEALRRERVTGPTARMRGLQFLLPDAPSMNTWWDIRCDGAPAGTVRSTAWSPRLACNVALAMVDAAGAATGSRVEVIVPGQRQAVEAIVVDLPMQARADGLTA